VEFRETPGVQGHPTIGWQGGIQEERGQQDAQKDDLLTRPTPARQDAPFRGQGRNDLSLTKGWLG
jgi:hypothetical protein